MYFYKVDLVLTKLPPPPGSFNPEISHQVDTRRQQGRPFALLDFARHSTVLDCEIRSGRWWGGGDYSVVNMFLLFERFFFLPTRETKRTNPNKLSKKSTAKRKNPEQKKGKGRARGGGGSVWAKGETNKVGSAIPVQRTVLATPRKPPMRFGPREGLRGEGGATESSQPATLGPKRGPTPAPGPRCRAVKARSKEPPLGPHHHHHHHRHRHRNR